MALLDAFGRPVKETELRREHADATVGGIRSPIREVVASTLNPKRLGSLLRDADQGDVESYITLAEEMEEREPHYRSVLATRKLAVSGVEVSVESGTGEAEDPIVDAVRQDLVEPPQFRDMLIDALDALGKGYSAVEIMWDTSEGPWKPKRYKWRDPRYFMWDPQTLTVLRLIDEQNISEGIDLPSFKFIVHVPKLKSGLPIRGGLARVAAAAYMFKAFTVRDWHIFMEVFGHPVRVGKYDQDATAEEREKLRKAVSAIGVDAAGIISKSMEIEFVSAMGAAGGDKLFQGAAEWWDKQVSKVVLGQTMTSEDGSSMAQAKVHDDVRLDLAQADARQLTATINRDLVKPYVDLNFGVQERYPQVSIKIDQPEDFKSKAETIKIMVNAGLPVPQWWAREAFGVPEVQGDEPILEPKKPPQPQMPPGAQPPTPEPPEPPEPNDSDALNHRIARLERAMNQQTRDDIDRLAGQMVEEQWEPMMDGLVGTIVQLAQSARDEEHFRALLDERDLPIDTATRQLAIAVFAARGLGDDRDRV